ncbi:MAG: EAL domain-containing protein [Bacillota bacterium]|nr:EAL domain-containing protein [Bacillota bacterium]
MKIRIYNKSKIFYTLLTGLAILIISVVTYYFASENLKNNVMESLVELSEQGGKTIEVELKNRLDLLQAISIQTSISNPNAPIEEKLNEIKRQASLSKPLRYGISDLKGEAITTDGKRFHIEDREYFQKAINGVSNISEPIISRADGSLVIAFAVPIKDDEGNIFGALHTTYKADLLTDIVKEIKLGDDSNAYIINKYGIIIANEDKQLVFNMANNIERAKNEPSLKSLAVLEENMKKGLTGSGEYTVNGMTRYMGYAPIYGTDWSIAVTASKEQATEKVHKVVYVINGVILLFLLISIIAGFYSEYLKRRLVYEEEASKHIIDIANIISIAVKYDGTIVSFNKYAEIKTQYNQQEVINKSFIDMLVEEDKEKFIKIREALRSTDSSENFDLSLKRKDGELLHIVWNANMKDDYKNKSLLFVINLIGMDITERIESERNIIESHEELTRVLSELELSQEELRNKYNELNDIKNKLLASEQRYYLSLEGANDAIWDWNAAEDKIFYSDKFYEIIGYNKEEIGSSLWDLKDLYHPDDFELVEEVNRNHINGITPNLSYEYRIKSKSEGYIWLLVKGKAVRDKSGKVIRMAGSITNINDRKMHEQMIKKLAYYDLLTGLPNRLILKERAERAIEERIRTGGSGALILIDIDNFKLLNDSYGHYFGDILLIEISNILTDLVDEWCVVSRSGGDEFTILVTRMDSISSIKDYCDNIMSAFSKTFNIQGKTFYITASMGISVFPNDSTDFNELLKDADTAMNHAKKVGKRNYKPFEKSLNDEVMEKVKIASRLRTALDNDEFELYYQPQYEANSDRIYGFEALIRWNSLEDGLVMPEKFIELAEETGLIVPIGDWVLRRACEFNKYLHNEGLNHLKISVNISMIQLMRESFPENVLSILSETGLDPRFLEIELTESVLIQSIDENLLKLQMLKDNGINISLDDFGKGFSSLSYLKVLPINTLKIDKAFVDDIGSNSDITGSIVHIAHKMGLGVIAEGVETREQLNHLIKNNCNVIQGYFIGRPVPENEAIKAVMLQKVL